MLTQLKTSSLLVQSFKNLHVSITALKLNNVMPLSAIVETPAMQNSLCCVCALKMTFNCSIISLNNKQWWNFSVQN